MDSHESRIHPPYGRKCDHNVLNIIAKFICDKERLTTLGYALGFEHPEIVRCLYDNPRDIWGASNKLLNTWRQREVYDDKRWKQLYAALQRTLPHDEMNTCDARIRGQDTGMFTHLLGLKVFNRPLKGIIKIIEYPPTDQVSYK